MELTDMLRTADSAGNLMPCYLNTKYSDAAIREGICEHFIDDDTGFQWIRLTPTGKSAKENADSGGATFVTDSVLGAESLDYDKLR